jgi:hypothetical protein
MEAMASLKAVNMAVLGQVTALQDAVRVARFVSSTPARPVASHQHAQVIFNQE